MSFRPFNVFNALRSKALRLLVVLLISIDDSSSFVLSTEYNFVWNCLIFHVVVAAFLAAIVCTRWFI